MNSLAHCHLITYLTSDTIIKSSRTQEIICLWPYPCRRTWLILLLRRQGLMTLIGGEIIVIGADKAVSDIQTRHLATPPDTDTGQMQETSRIFRLSSPPRWSCRWDTQLHRHTDDYLTMKTCDENVFETFCSIIHQMLDITPSSLFLLSPVGSRNPGYRRDSVHYCHIMSVRSSSRGFPPHTDI